MAERRDEGRRRLEDKIGELPEPVAYWKDNNFVSRQLKEAIAEDGQPGGLRRSGGVTRLLDSFRVPRGQRGR